MIGGWEGVGYNDDIYIFTHTYDTYIYIYLYF